jgi:hypothetical protein
MNMSAKRIGVERVRLTHRHVKSTVLNKKGARGY